MAEEIKSTSPNAQFLAGDASAAGANKAPLGSSLFVSIAVHTGLLLLLIMAASRVSDTVADVTKPLTDVIWIEQPGPGGGGGGSPDPAPVKKAEIPKPKIVPPPSPTPTPVIPKEAVVLPPQ